MANNPPTAAVPGIPSHISKNPGAIPDDYTGTDYAYKPPEGAKVEQSVNLRSNPAYNTFLDPFYNQGLMGSCVANASAACYRFEYKRHSLESKIQNGQPVSPARLFIYYNARAIVSDKLVDNGCQVRDALKSLAKKGVCEEATWPYVMLKDQEKGQNDKSYQKYKDTETGKQPSPAAFTEAAKHMIVGYYRLDIDRDPKKTIGKDAMDADGKHVLDNVRYCLSEGHPVVTSFYWPEAKTQNVFTSTGPNNIVKLAPLSNIKETHAKIPSPRSGHAILIVGYDEQAKAVLCQNSWGDGHYPLIWIPYDWITDFTATNDFWMVRVVGN